MRNSKSCIILFLLVYLITIAGCGGRSPQADYYTLSSIEEMSEIYEKEKATVNLAIGIGPVKFPDELDRSSIVIRSGQNRLNVSEFHRWGGSLEKNFSRVMVENLAYLMKTVEVVARPWQRFFQPDYRIALDVQKFSGKLDKYATLRVTWMIFNNKKDVPALVKKSTIQEPVTDGSYDALVAAQSKALAGLCQEIATSLLEIEKDRL